MGSVLDLFGSQPTVPLPAQAPQQGSSILSLFGDAPAPPETGIIKASVAGFIRGATQPFALLPPVAGVSNRMKQFYGTTNPTKVSYGLGYAVGTLLPVTLHYKIASKIVGKIGGALVAADNAANYTRLGHLVRGSIAGALYGAGQQADDLEDAFKHVWTNALIGGAADVVIPAAWSVLSSPFSGKTNSKIDDVLNATLDLSPEPGVVPDAVPPPPPPKVETEGVRAHARAMQLLDQLDTMTEPVNASTVGSVSTNVTGPVRSGPFGDIGLYSLPKVEQVAKTGQWWDKQLTKHFVENPDDPWDVVIPDPLVNQARLDYTWPRHPDHKVYGELRQSYGDAMEGSPMYKAWFKRRFDQLIPPEQETVTLYKVAPVSGRGFRGKYGNGTMTYHDTDIFQYKAAEEGPILSRVGGAPATIFEITVPRSDVIGLGDISVTEMIYKLENAKIRDIGLELRQAAAAASAADVPTSAFSVLQPVADRRMALQAGLQRMNLENLLPGEIRAIPTPHDDGVILGKLLDAADLDNVVIPGKDPHVLAAHKGTTSLARVAADIAKHGFARGQKALYKGQEYIAVKPTAAGDKVHLTQPGRLKKPIVADKADVQFLPSIQDVLTQGLRRQPAVLADDFISAETLWPDQGIDVAFERFARSRNLNPNERNALMEQLMKLQRAAVGADDPAVEQTMKVLEAEIPAIIAKGHPDGPLDELVSQKGLAYTQKLINGEWHYILKDARGQVVSPPLPSRKHATEWLHNYGVAPGNVIDTPSPVADNVVPGVGTPSVPPHTAGEISSYSFNPALNLFARLMPNGMYLKFAEDKLTQLNAVNAAGDAIRPYTRVFLNLSKKKLSYYNALKTQLKGGTDESGKVTGLLNIFKPGSKLVRQSAKEDVIDLVERPISEWGKASAGLTDSEVKVARQLRGQLEEWYTKYIQDADIKISPEEFIEKYLPHFRRLSNAEAPASVKMLAQMEGREINKPAMDFLSDMFRMGEMKKWDRDPFAVALNFLRSGLYKTHLKTTLEDAMEHVRSIPETTGDLVALKKQLINYMHLVSYGAPEAFSNVNLAFKGIMSRLGIHIPDESRDRLINSFMAMNYSAYMGYRPGLIIRNLSQTLLTTYPLLGAKYTGYGLRVLTANKKAAYDEMRRVGVFMSEHVAVPGEDLYFADLAQQSLTARGLLSKAGDAVKKVGEHSLAWFNSADKINRAVAYFGQKRKTIDAWNLFSEKAINEEKFLSKSGLNYFGDSVKGEFQRIRAAQGIESAAEFLGSIAASDTQWIYQMGAGPALFSHGIGRLVGQYGTWPMWYASYIAQGMKNLKGLDRAGFIFRNIAMHKAIIATGAAAGFNLSRWTGLSSLSWMGGPLVDWFSDMRDVVTGVQQGGDPTAERQIALSRYGLQDTGGEGVSMLPTLLGGRIQMNDPARFAGSFFSILTPGYNFIFRDIPNAANSPDGVAAAAAVLNLPVKTAGQEWPEIH